MMSDRVHAALDGEIDPERLSADERRAYERLKLASGRVAAEIERSPAPDLAAGVTARLPDAPSRTVIPIGAYLRRVRTPVAMAAVLTLAFFIGRHTAPGPPPDVAVAEAPTEFVVQVHFHGEAEEVRLVGSFSGWSPDTPLRQVEPGIWHATVRLSPGLHDFAFLVDGEVRTDPLQRTVRDAFGSSHHRVVLEPRNI